MEPPNKKPRGEWTETQLKKALQAINSGQMSQRKAAAEYSIPRRTLRNHIKSKSTEKITGRVPILNKIQEKSLCKRVIRLAQIGMPLTPKLIRKQAYEFCITNNIPNCFNEKKNIAGKKWLKNFVTRNPEIALRRAQLMNPARAQKLNKPIVLKHFDTLKNIYDELNICSHPERLYNMDEKGCRLTLHHQQKVYAAKGTKRVHLVAQEHAENVTIAMCVNATGNCLPPMIIFKGKRLRPEFCENLPPGSSVKMAPKGSMTTELFVDFIQHLGRHKSPEKCLLIFDGASSHLDARIVDAADAHNIVLYCLPSNTTHELQPLDKSVNRSYEQFWDEEVLLYAYQNPDRKITKSRFNKIFTKVWSKCMTTGNIISGFRATGLFPYDPNAIPVEAYAPSILTQLPNPHDSLQNVSIMHDSTCDMAAPQDSILRSSVISARRDNCSDSDVTDCEENLGNFSPSILTQNELSELREHDVFEHRNVLTNPQCPTSTRKLVSYSSSSEFSDLNVSDIQKHVQEQPYLDNDYRNTEFCSPVPTTSGINMQSRPRLNSFTSDSSNGEDLDTCSKYFQYLPKPSKLTKRIYSSSSESDEENLNPNCRELIPISEQNQVQFDESEDDLPLTKYKEDVGNSASKSPFHKQIPTPNFATIKKTPRRKALNYIGQKITKDLFNAVKDKAKRNTKKELINKPTRGESRLSDTNKSKRCGQNKEKVKRLSKKSRHTESSKIKQISKDCKKSKKADGWYCHGCEKDRIADMRICITCQNWYHEECVGLTTEDEEQFVCPDCN